MFKFLNEKGQALLIVVLVMVVALTVGLAVVSRSIVNLRNSQQEVGSQQALSAAEAGIEQSIKTGSGVENGTFSTSTSYQTSVNTISGTSDFLLNGNNKVSQDDASYIWLTPYSDVQANLFQTTWSGSLDIYWGDSLTPCNNAALEVAVLWNSAADPKITKDPRVTRYVYDPCVSRITRNNFSTPASINANKSILGITLNNEARLVNITNGFLIRVVPLYGDAYIGVSPTDPTHQPLPHQGAIVTSTGTTGNNIQRKLEVFQGYPEIPAELFPFSLFWP